VSSDSSDEYEITDEDLYKEIGPPIPGKLNFTGFSIFIHVH